MRRALIIDGTGNQGGTTIRHLLKRGWQVRVLVRDLGEPAAKDLSAAGAEFVRGDMEDAVSLEAAMRAVDTVFSMQVPAYEPETLKAEVRQGTLVASAYGCNLGAAQGGVDVEIGTLGDAQPVAGVGPRWPGSRAA
ncbi:NmrA family NAD(P)-binding protein [Streptosporangium sp. NPDC006013]|uniref:NmrA family NAD(P)-binding protein n=1 Tax=Streptosporangium sp. NPDC006013 TaxID=3155596 RepID=UPI0033B3568E